MIEMQIVWLKDPVKDVLDAIIVEESCTKLCREKTETTCGTECTGFSENS